MIKHVPFGLGHPYRTEPFERSPHFPTPNEVITFRVMATQEVLNVLLNLSDRSEFIPMRLIGPARSSDLSDYGKTAKELLSNTHLEDAAIRSGEYDGLNEWEVEVSDIKKSCQYSFSANKINTERYNLEICNWEQPENSNIEISGANHFKILNESWLVDSKGDAHMLRFSLPIEAGQHFVGLGERFHAVDQKGEKVDAIVYEEYKGQGHRTYLPTPFVNVIGGNYGFHVATSRHCRFDFGKTNPSELIVEVLWNGKPNGLKINFYEGSPSEVLNQYLLEVGKPNQPPSWIFKLWLSSNEWNTQERVNREVSQAKEAGIQAGVLVIEAWSDESTFTVFRDAKYQVTDGKDGLKSRDISYPADGAWPNPKGMIESLHNDGIKILLWQIPVLKECSLPESQAQINWNYAIQNRMVIENEDGSSYRVPGFWFQNGLLPDLTDSRVREWWTNQREYLVKELGVDGFKTDGGEHPWSPSIRYLDGETGDVKNNLFAKFYSQAFHELMIRNGKSAVTFSRAGFTGSQAFPTFWAGDENSTWKAFKASIIAGITASASGFFHWGWDIGGFSGEIPTPELYLRSAAMSIFTPIMQIHSEFNHHRIPSNDRTPWNIAQRYSNPEILEYFKRYTDLRNKLIPYIESESQIAIDTGRPLMAGLFFDFSDDKEIWKTPTQFMFGRFLLVAPVTDEGLEEIPIYLPKGRWIDVWTGHIYDGNKWIEVSLENATIPVFAKENIDLKLLDFFRNF